MTKGSHSDPLQFKGVMVSSTFTDLEKHRAALIKAIKGQGLTEGQSHFQLKLRAAA